MKLKSLLTVACLAVTLPSMAVIPLKFRDACNTAPDGGGHFDFPVKEGTQKTDPETGAITYYGDPLFEEDGSITCVTNAGCSGGVYIRTAKTLTEKVPDEYCVLALDYKSDRTQNNIVVFHHEGFNNYTDICNGNIMEVTDEFKSVYVPVTFDKSGWGKGDNFASNYMWISFNDANAHQPGWHFTVKNIRLLTLKEASEECGAVSGDYLDALTCANGDIVSDLDPDMGANVYCLGLGATNPVLATSSIVKPLPAANTMFVVEYKYVGEAPFAPTFLPVQGGAYTLSHRTKDTSFVPLDATAEPYEAEWSKFEIDLSKLRTEINFGNTFGCNDCLHIQMIGLKDGETIWLRNPRWVNPNGSGIADVIAPAAALNVTGLAGAIAVEAEGAFRVYNLAGAAVAAGQGSATVSVAPGLYIVAAGQAAVKVVVK